ncbi:MAG: hypothetical protein ABI901_05400 [Roseiflexaceae bacterium]
MSADMELTAFAAEYAITLATARELLDELRAQAGAERFYIFWTTGGAGTGASGRKRTLLAFPTPDTALAFAQRNGLGSPGEQPRLRRFALLQLLQAMLREPAILALLLAADDDPPPAGQLPRGTRIERAELLRRLTGSDQV